MSYRPAPYEDLNQQWKGKCHLNDIDDDEELPMPKMTKVSTRKKEKRAVAGMKEKDTQVYMNEDIEIAEK